MMRRWWSGGVAGLMLFGALAASGGARAEGDYGPDKAAQTLRGLRMYCAIGIGCPLTFRDYGILKSAVAGDREAQYQAGLLLDYGENLARDQHGAVGWYGKAAEQGYAQAALALNARRHDGMAIEADEAKIAAALKIEGDKGDTDAMRALADMYVYGRGVARSADEAKALLQRSSEKGSAAAEQDLATLYLHGAPGFPQNRSEGFRWMGLSGSHGNLEAMNQLGYMYFNSPDSAARDPAEGYRWLMRASLIDYPRA